MGGVGCGVASQVAHRQHDLLADDRPEVGRQCSPDPPPSWLAPPAASVSSARGNVSYRQRSLAEAEAEVGLQNTPPPCRWQQRRAADRGEGVEREAGPQGKRVLMYCGAHVETGCHDADLAPREPKHHCHTEARKERHCQRIAAWLAPCCAPRAALPWPVCGEDLAPGRRCTAGCTAPTSSAAPGRDTLTRRGGGNEEGRERKRHVMLGQRVTLTCT